METQNHHPASFDLDLFNAGALPAGQVDRIHLHLQSCVSCRAYLRDLEARKGDLHGRMPVEAFVAAVRERAGTPADPEKLPLWKPLLGAAMAASLVLVLALVFWPAGPDTVRTRGGFLVEAFVKKQNRVVMLDRTVTVQAGDSVRFKLRLPDPGYLTVFFLSGDGKLSWYLPDSAGAAPIRVKAGEVALPGSARFDASPVVERAFLFYSPETFEPVRVAERIRKAWEQSRDSDFGSSDWLPSEEGLESLVFRK